MNFLKRYLTTWTYYLDNEGKPQYISKFPKEITPEVISDFKSKVKDIDGPALKSCYLAVKSEGTRMDSSFPSTTSMGATLLALTLTIMFTFFIAQSQANSIYYTTISKLPLGWKTTSTSSIHLSNIFFWILVYIVIVITAFMYGINKDSQKRAYLSVMLTILEEKLVLENIPNVNRNLTEDFEALILIRRIDQLRSDGLLTEEEFHSKKAELLQRV